MVAATLAVGLLIGNSQLPIPALAGQSGEFLVGHLITLAPAVLLLYGTGRGDLRTESVASRPLRRWDVVLAVSTAAVSLLAAMICQLAVSTGIAMVLGRNIAGYIGLALILHPLIGYRLAGASLAAVPLICAAAGWRAGGRPEPWAWLLHDGDSHVAMAMAAVTLAAGSVMTLVLRNPAGDIAESK
ncbi:hypothetical protein [Streptomyces sp. bgisy100]|uniref:hypothetical protein n=1 Tax=Streptomyces sp. bgisy100 TaxID=3413783 RepID=UPI003D723C25